MNVDLTGQTSQIYTMRNHFNKCLLAFEAYVISGQYAAELAMQMAPSTEHAQPYIPSPETEALVSSVLPLHAVVARGRPQEADLSPKRVTTSR